MSDCVKETLCTKCEHREVCKYKKDYLNILKSVNDAYVNFTTDDGKGAMKKVIDYDFIGEIKVPCKYYYQCQITTPNIGTISYRNRSNEQ